jgi:hypothetical protein
MSSEKQNTARASSFRVTGCRLSVVKQIGAADLCGRVPAFGGLIKQNSLITVGNLGLSLLIMIYELQYNPLPRESHEI